MSASASNPTVAIFNVALIGHVNPTFPLVQELVRRGCRVHYFLPKVPQIWDAARESGAIVESYLPDVPELVLEECGTQVPPEDLRPEEQEAWARAVWPLASTLLCGEHVIQRCQDLGVSVVLYDPAAPHGLLVALKLGIPKASLVTFPGIGSLGDIMAHQDRLEKLAGLRAPLGQAIEERFGVDLQVNLLTRRHYLTAVNFITTCKDLVAPVPSEAAWAQELSRFRFLPIGCLVSSTAPHISSAPGKVPGNLRDDLPMKELHEQLVAGRRIIFAALGTMALNERWNMDLGRVSSGNLPTGTTGKQYCQHVWKALLCAMEDLGDEFYCVLCAGKQPDALDFLEKDSQLPQNVIVRASVPQVEMLNSYASVFLSHVGFNSLQESLMAGVPLVAVPQAVDQPANAMKVQNCSWGISFLHPMETVTSSAMASALRSLACPSSPCRAAVQAARQHLEGGVERLAEKLLEMQ
ncbi:Uncharacterized UDP-glucosyltransferase YjiC [Durusdinium trenchii]